MSDKWDKGWIGFCIGIVTPLIVLIGYYLIKYNYMTIHSFINMLMRAESLAAVVSLAVIGNLIFFYVFLQKEYYKTVRGIIGATFIYAGFVLIMKLDKMEWF